MKRRDFISLLGSAVAVWPLVARAQQAGQMRRIGVLTVFPKNDPLHLAYMAALREGLQKLGWIEGRNIRIDIGWAAPDMESTQRFAEELVAQQPDLIITENTLTTASTLKHTRAIPIIFVNVADPIGSGFVANFPRPVGNVTGFLTMEPTIGSKWLELLKEIAPRVSNPRPPLLRSSHLGSRSAPSMGEPVADQRQSGHTLAGQSSQSPGS
jgi:putative tryptophan/tyrosine transport system substrate-binding protein